MLDTNVVVAAMRSPSGASAELLRKARRGEFVMVANVALALEYEATCSRAEHVLAAGLTSAQAEIFVDAVVALAEPVESHFMWRPVLRDPGDEMVLEAAANGRAQAIATFNRRHFDAMPPHFGIEILSPRAALRRFAP